MRSLIVAGLALFAVLPACAMSAADNGANSSADIVSDPPEAKGEAITAAPDDPCTATLHFMQKDAYKDGAGRTSDLWPPHTTTVLEVTCQTASGPQTTKPFDANHGTLPDAKDATGTTILVEVPMDASVVTTSAPWSEMQKLIASYTTCECQPDTFLSMDAVTPQAMGIINEVASLFDCQQPTSALLAAAQAKDVATVKSILAGCTLKADVTPDQFEETADDVETTVQQTMAGKHVCNNDALLQADLFASFRDNKTAPTCNPHDANRCAFPKLFFRPAAEVQ